MLKSPPPARNAAHDKRRLVLDTNVIVSGLLTPNGVPGQIVQMAMRGRLCLVYSAAIASEYTEVLARPKFGFLMSDVNRFLTAVYANGSHVRPPAKPHPLVKDASDIPFFSAAECAGCPLVTGNQRDYPTDAGVEILSPVEFIGRVI